MESGSGAEPASSEGQRLQPSEEPSYRLLSLELLKHRACRKGESFGKVQSGPGILRRAGPGAQCRMPYPQNPESLA